MRFRYSHADGEIVAKALPVGEFAGLLFGRLGFRLDLTSVKLPVHDPPVAWRVGGVDVGGMQVVCVPEAPHSMIAPSNLTLPVLLDAEPGRRAGRG